MNNTPKIDMVGQQPDGRYTVILNGIPYNLDEAQYKAINRKKDMPISRLIIWLQSYADEIV